MEEEILNKLRGFYKITVIPATVFFVLSIIFSDRYKFDSPDYMNWLSIVLSLFFALIFPILFRIYNFYNVNAKGAMSLSRFMIFEKIQLLVSQISVYILTVSNFLISQKYILIALSVIAFYALFYHYPTEKKINLDKRIFMPEKRNRKRKYETD